MTDRTHNRVAAGFITLILTFMLVQLHQTRLLVEHANKLTRDAVEAAAKCLR